MIPKRIPENLQIDMRGKVVLRSDIRFIIDYCDTVNAVEPHLIHGRINPGLELQKSVVWFADGRFVGSRPDEFHNLDLINIDYLS